MNIEEKCKQLADSMKIKIQPMDQGRLLHIHPDYKKFKQKYKTDWHDFHKAGNINSNWEETYEQLVEIKEKFKQLKKEKKVSEEKAVEVKVETASKDERGRKSAYRGKTLVAKTQENKRRKGSAGQISLQIIIDNSPIVYEAYIAAGGRRQDLAHDIKEDRVEIKES
jgi:hypothetical protein